MGRLILVAFLLCRSLEEMHRFRERPRLRLETAFSPSASLLGGDTEFIKQAIFFGMVRLAVPFAVLPPCQVSAEL